MTHFQRQYACAMPRHTARLNHVPPSIPHVPPAAGSKYTMMERSNVSFEDSGSLNRCLILHFVKS